MGATPQERLAAARPKTLGQHIRNIVLWLIIIGAIAAAGIWFKNKVDKQRNLEDSILQELKQPQEIALDAIAADPGAKAALGDDIKDAGGLGRDGSGVLDRTDTTIHFNVAGSKGKGRVTARTAQKQGSWQIADDIEVKLADGKTIKVSKPGDKPPDINLDF